MWSFVASATRSARSRVVTIAGLGGMGKSRLAAEYVHRQRLVGASVLWAALGTCHDPRRVADHVATSVGLLAEDAPTAVAALAASIGWNDILLVLDGAENVASEAAALALQLIESCPRLRVLVTSRLPIGLPGERLVELGPLDVPPAEGPVRGTALELLVDRLNLDVAALDATTRDHLVAVCEQSGGVPLLVELQAAAVDVARGGALPPQPARRSHNEVVREAIHDALDEVDDVPRRLVNAMAQMPAGVSEESAAALLGVPDTAARRALRLLAWTHLVDARVGYAGLRYQSLDPVREAIVEGLAEHDRAEALRRAVAVMEEMLRSVRPPGMSFVVERLDVADDEHDNILFLLSDRLTRDPDAAVELAISACEYWPVRGHIVEGRGWLDRAVLASKPEGDLRWRAVVALARITRTFGEVAELREQLEDVVIEMRAEGADDLLFGTGLMYLAMARGWRGDGAAANAALDEAERLDDRVGTPWTRAHIVQLRDLGRALVGDLAGARRGMQRFGERMEALDDPVSAAIGWYLSATMGDMAGATDLRDDIAHARRLAESHRDTALLSQLIRIEARLLQRIGDPEARELLRTAAERLAQGGGIRAAALARLDLALIDLDAGEPAAATEQLSSALPVLVHLDPAGAALGAAALAKVAEGYGDTSVARRLVAVARALGSHPAGTAERARAEVLLAGLPAPDPGAAISTDVATSELLTLLEAPPFG